MLVKAIQYTDNGWNINKTKKYELLENVNLMRQYALVERTLNWYLKELIFNPESAI